ncbi:DUF1127 domain-containing protein [Methylobrevis pamukkalensis]|uniref:YjiS-like domain-containing protein n=1 Tax=Methylobrevis pamukkalensis TaxID=1439726 RepID=A0A1E3H5V3_9HYPH|nr:DUF1127 domain-containing protein [Methylobrevis pamukkalensis]ODN71692.1 hypothetical protein A6302_00936 [Methylobrevis pamukkalensis]
MTTIVTTSLSRSAGETSFVTKAVRTMNAAVEVCVRYNRKRQTRHTLRELDDRILRDIGLERSEVGYPVLAPTSRYTEWR